MKILIIQPWISFRGAETVSVKLCLALNRLGHSSKIACLFLDDKLPKEAEQISFILPPKILQYLFRRSRIFFLIFGPLVLFFLILVSSFDFDVFNPHNPPSLWPSVLLGRLFGKKVIWTVHNLFDFGILNPADNFFVKRVDYLVAPTNKIAKKIRKVYKRKAEVIYNAV